VVLAPTGYVNPFRNSTSLTPERIDMGVDYAGSGPIVAIGDATIGEVASASAAGWPGVSFISYQLDDGPPGYKGKWVYVAEDITPVPGLHPGQHVSAGQQIATFGPNTGSGIETGWALPGSSEPVAGTYYKEGMRTAAGQAFSDLLVSLGAPAGCIEGRPLVGSYP
jgi:hypothetical protein